MRVAVTLTVFCYMTVRAEDIHFAKFTKPFPSEILYRVGQSPFVIQCLASGNGVEYFWTKDNKPFEYDSNLDISQREDEGSLVFLKPKNEDEGVYRCHAKTKYGVTRSTPISVKRTYINLSEVTPTRFTPIEGKPFHLPCPIPEGYPKPTVKWFFQHAKDASVSDAVLDKRITLDPQGTLWFSNVTQEDASTSFKYVCKAYSPALDKAAEVAEAFIEKVVDDKGKLDNELVAQYVSQDFTTVTGGTTELFCIYGGTPLAHPDWFKDGKDTNNKPGDRVTRYNRTAGKRLLIRDTIYEDAANYTCEVDNGIGAKQVHSMILKVEGKPVFSAKPEEETRAKKGQDVFVPCKATATPAPKISYTFNGQELPKTEQYVISAEGLTIKNVDQKDVGIYGCEVVNAHGLLYSETGLYVQ